MPKPAVIVVNSHVVRGSVGGRSSVFALERMGFPVWALTTVSLAWHPGHGRSTRVAPDDAAFAAAVGDLAGAPGLGEVAAILVGYLGSEAQVEPLARLVETLKRRNPAILFLYDPDIGDGDTFFQPASLAAAARDKLLPLADISTPNRFELGWLTGGVLRSEDEAASAAAKLGPPEVVVTSATVSPNEIGMVLFTDGAVQIARQAAVAASPKGTGDLFAALYLGHRLDGRAPAAALQRAAAAVARLAEQAVALQVDELPLASGQDAFAAAPTGITVKPWAGARGKRPA